MKDSRRAFASGWTLSLLVGAVWLFLLFLAVDLQHVAKGVPRRPSGDEWRYIYYAKNLIEGYFSPPDRVFLWNGPAYPLLIVPFVKAGWEDGARYLNAFFHAGAVVYAWLVFRPRMPPLWAALAAAALGIYAPARDHLVLIYTECLCFFLVAGWVYHSLAAPRSVPHRIVAGVYLGILCLTKVVFGPALVVFGALLALYWRFRRRSPLVLSHITAAGIGLLLCVPYLVYTYELTGRVFYWASAWPNTFYWLTSPYPDEYGDWYHQGWVFNNPVLRSRHLQLYLDTTGLAQNPNLGEIEQLLNISSPEAADVFLERSLANVREHPLKFVSNWGANLLRLFFDVPVGVRGTPFWNPATRANLPLLLFTSGAAAFVWRTRQRIPRQWLPIALFVTLTIAAYSLSSIIARYLVPIVPLWWLVVCAVLARSIRFRRLAHRRARPERKPHLKSD